MYSYRTLSIQINFAFYDSLQKQHNLRYIVFQIWIDKLILIWCVAKQYIPLKRLFRKNDLKNIKLAKPKSFYFENTNHIFTKLGYENVEFLKTLKDRKGILSLTRSELFYSTLSFHCAAEELSFANDSHKTRRRWAAVNSDKIKRDISII